MGMAAVRIENPAGYCFRAAEVFKTYRMNYSCLALQSAIHIGEINFWRTSELVMALNMHVKLHEGKVWWNKKEFTAENQEARLSALLETAQALAVETRLPA